MIIIVSLTFGLCCVIVTPYIKAIDAAIVFILVNPVSARQKIEVLDNCRIGVEFYVIPVLCLAAITQHKCKANNQA